MSLMEMGAPVGGPSVGSMTRIWASLIGSNAFFTSCFISLLVRFRFSLRLRVMLASFELVSPMTYIQKSALDQNLFLLLKVTF